MATVTDNGRGSISAAAPPRSSGSRIDNGSSSVKVFNWICGAVLVVFAIVWLIPSLYAIQTSLTPNSTSALGATKILSTFPSTLHSYVTLFQQGDILRWYLASAVTSVVTVFLTVLTASMAAYALSRLRFRGRTAVLFLVLAGIMIPGQVLIVPWFREFNAIHTINTYWAVILPQVPSVIAVFVFKQFFDGLPKELDEAARVDGAGFWMVYRRVVMPLCKPAISAVSIFTFVWTWNNLLWPLIALSNPKLMTIPVGLATVQGSFGQRYSDIMASSILGALPLILLFLFFQRRIVEGIAGTGLKG
jgi:multiple sugar transport system permease protein